MYVADYHTFDNSTSPFSAGKLALFFLHQPDLSHDADGGLEIAGCQGIVWPMTGILPVDEQTGLTGMVLPEWFVQKD